MLAVLNGKTNLDQFATAWWELNFYGFGGSVYNRAYISGGSSSGSAVAVAAGLTAFALGTDTAGSGRVPAAPTILRRTEADGDAEHLVGWSCWQQDPRLHHGPRLDRRGRSACRRHRRRI